MIHNLTYIIRSIFDQIIRVQLRKIILERAFFIEKIDRLIINQKRRKILAHIRTPR